jgi:hypothetical protein
MTVSQTTDPSFHFNTPWTGRAPLSRGMFAFNIVEKETENANNLEEHHPLLFCHICVFYFYWQRSQILKYKISGLGRYLVIIDLSIPGFWVVLSL